VATTSPGWGASRKIFPPEGKTVARYAAPIGVSAVVLPRVVGITADPVAAGSVEGALDFTEGKMPTQAINSDPAKNNGNIRITRRFRIDIPFKRNRRIILREEYRP
jgi:hypothetical protein